MIGIITAYAVITSLETLLLANTQEFSLAYSLLHDSLTCFMIYIMIIVQGAKFHVSRCLIYKVHSVKRNSFIISCCRAFVKNFFRSISKQFLTSRRQPDYFNTFKPLCQEVFSQFNVSLNGFFLVLHT